ncbi:MAG: PEP-CTERM sorting domain-containing protein [Planctomycetota bacterium]
MRGKLHAVGLAVLAVTVAADASPMTIEDRNTTLCVDPDSKHGIASWCVDGTHHLAKEWFWFRFEGVGAETPLDALDLIDTQLTDTNTLIDDRADTLTAYYGCLDTFYIETRLALQGGQAGSGTADLVEQLAFHNRTDRPLTLWFFQYADFDLGDTARDDRVVIQGGNTARQTDAGTILSETVVTPRPLRVEANHWCSTLGRLCDDTITMLNNTPGPCTGDVTWAFEWRLDLPAGGSALISKDKHLVPEPATAGLLALGGLALLGRKRHRDVRSVTKGHIRSL